MSTQSGAPVGPVLVVGTGLLGTSIGLALRRRGVQVHLRDALPGRAREAADLGAGTDLPPDDPVLLAVVATPPGAVGATVAALQRERFAQGYTDVASVKSRPLRDLELAGGDLSRYVGGHPLAGSERSGPRAGRGDLFEGRPWVLCPGPHSAVEVSAGVEALARACGAVPVVMEAAEHDEAVAVVSHLPHLLAALVAARLAVAADTELAVAGQGVRDVTRIAAGDPALWTEIVRDNAGPVLAQLREVRADLDRLIETLSMPGQGLAGLTELLVRGNQGRARIPGKHGGPATAYQTVPVVVPDHPGELARLLHDAGAAGVNVEDLRIEHSPGQPAGLVELAVAPQAAEALAAALRSRGWTVHGEAPGQSHGGPAATAG